MSAAMIEEVLTLKPAFIFGHELELVKRLSDLSKALPGCLCHLNFVRELDRGALGFSMSNK